MATASPRTAASPRQTNFVLIIALCLVAILLAGGVAAIGFGMFYLRRLGKDPIEAAAGFMKGDQIQVRVGDRRLTVGKGDITGVSNRLPNYPGATIEGSVAAEDEKQSGALVVMFTPEAADKVVEFYRQTLLKADYAIVAADLKGMKGASPDGDRTVSISITAKPGGTLIALTYADK